MYLDKRGSFLMIFEEPHEVGKGPGKPELRALVRRVRLQQLGAWMMGSAHINKQFGSVTLSGSYGSDGLPIYLPHKSGFDVEKAYKLWPRLHQIPAELQAEFWAGGGHNTAGKEGSSFRQWGLENLALLKHLK